MERVCGCPGRIGDPHMPECDFYNDDEEPAFYKGQVARVALAGITLLVVAYFVFRWWFNH
jgi:hypothetical protein